MSQEELDKSGEVVASSQRTLQLQRTMAHDVRNLLTGPTGLIELIIEDIKASKEVDLSQLVEDLTTIHASLLNAAALTNRVMDADGNLRINKEELELRTLIDSVIAYCQTFLAKGVKLNFFQADNLVINADRANLFSALLNVVKNAGEALGEHLRDIPNPMINVRFLEVNFGHHRQPSEFLRNGHHVVIEVVDNGPGIPVQHRKAIFEGGMTTKGNLGHGIGLPMVMQIVRAHGGDILLKSLTEEEIYRDPERRGQTPGTKFSIFLPIAKKKE